MRRCISILAPICVVILLTASAAKATFALPVIKVLSGDIFPVTAEGASKKGVRSVAFEESAGVFLEAEEVKGVIEIAGAGPEGSIRLSFIRTVFPGFHECSTEGDAKGVVLLSGTVRLVPVSTSSLELGALITLSPVTLTCNEGKNKLKLSGSPILRLVVPVTAEGEDVTSFSLSAKCTAAKGVQELRSYFNDEEMQSGIKSLLVNLGLGNENGCMRFAEDLSLKSSKMIAFSG